MNKTINVSEVKELNMEELAFVSGGCNVFPDSVKIEDYFYLDHQAERIPRVITLLRF